MKIREGSIVGRNSYNKDILFVVYKIFKSTTHKDYAILKGLNTRIQADALLDDLEVIDKTIVNKYINNLDKVIEKRIELYKNSNIKRNNIYNKMTGKILHLDGDRRYSEKSARYYKKMGLNAIVKNIAEYKQPENIKNILEIYKPDILVVTRT